MAVASRTTALAILLASALLFEEWASTPSCAPNDAVVHEGEALRVMMVADLLLIPRGGGGGGDGGGPHSPGAYLNSFRDYFLSKSFQWSFRRLNPDMLLVMGDVRGGGPGPGWVPVVRKFNQVIGPFLDLPYHVVLGDRDVGGCDSLDARSVYVASRAFPGLDPSGCGSFEIANVSFVSLNVVAFLCRDNALRYGVEKAVEVESLGWGGDGSGGLGEGLGPVVLVHFPLHGMGSERCSGGSRGVPMERDELSVLRLLLNKLDKSSEILADAPYRLSQTVSRNATDYIFQALKPRIIFSAHKYEFCDHTHADGTREVTIPAMSWRARDDPGFVLATFHGEGNPVHEADPAIVLLELCNLAVWMSDLLSSENIDLGFLVSNHQEKNTRLCYNQGDS